jgi:hypothetical protein
MFHEINHPAIGVPYSIMETSKSTSYLGLPMTMARWHLFGFLLQLFQLVLGISHPQAPQP